MGMEAFSTMTEHQLVEEMRDSFTKSPISTRSAVKALNNLALALSRGEVKEGTMRSAYMTLLKGFQSKDQYLRSCIYPAIEELARHTDEGYIGVNVLVNDLNGGMPDDVKAMALRALFAIVPGDMMHDFGRYITQAVVSTSLARKDAAVLVMYKLFFSNAALVKRWMEGVEMVGDLAVNHHIVGLLAQAKRLQMNSVEGLRGAAGIIGVRMLTEGLKEGGEAFPIFKRLIGSKHSDELVFIEAAKAVCRMNEEYAVQFVPQTVQSLRVFLRSSDVVLQFSAMKIMATLALRYPQHVSIANKEIEDLVSSANKAISVFAITALLKTGTEETIDRLVGLIPGVIHEMSDESKRIAIETLESLSNNFDTRRAAYVDFLNDALMQKSGLEFKKYMVGVIGRAVKRSDSRERILEMLCAYIEDSQYYQVTLDILGILGEEIPKSTVPGKYVVHILNRLVLENNHVRAATLQCLYNISCSISSSVAERAIRNCLFDKDEMIRDMAFFLLGNMRTGEKRRTEPFDMKELGEMREAVLEHLDVAEQESEESGKEGSGDGLFVKECRELCLTEGIADVQVKVVKKMFRDSVVLVFSIENRLEDVQVSEGLLSLVCSGRRRTETSVNVERIGPMGVFVVEKELEAEEGCVINGVFDYTVCAEKDLSDTETDSLALEPFRISILDFVSPVLVEEGKMGKKDVSFALQGNVYAAGKKILDLLNMRIVSQDSGTGTMKMIVSGKLNETGVRIHVELVEKSSLCMCSVRIFCSEDVVREKIARLFD